MPPGFGRGLFGVSGHWPVGSILASHAEQTAARPAIAADTLCATVYAARPASTTVTAVPKERCIATKPTKSTIASGANKRHQRPSGAAGATYTTVAP